MLMLTKSAEDACRDSYAYAYDEQSGTALWTCDKNLAADYTITFCPGAAAQPLLQLQDSDASSEQIYQDGLGDWNHEETDM